MHKQLILIEAIPAIVFGTPAKDVYIFVHGRMSKKEEAEKFALIAERKGYQTLSFDLPEHGDRKFEKYPCNIQNGIHDLRLISNYVTGKWKTIALFGNSLGAYFSLAAYQNLKFAKCLFLSPILDMEHLIQNMMAWFNITEGQLKEKLEILTPIEETLSWAYYTYVKENPIVKWDNPTYILYGANDNLTERYIIDSFVTKYHCDLEVLQNGESSVNYFL